MSDPQVVDVPGTHRYEVRVDDEVAGYAEYEQRGDAVAVLHTVVDPRFEGRGLGTVLARAVVDAARASGQPLLPVCPFVRRWLEKHPDQLDVVPGEQRAKYGLPAA